MACRRALLEGNGADRLQVLIAGKAAGGRMIFEVEVSEDEWGGGGG